MPVYETRMVNLTRKNIAAVTYAAGLTGDTETDIHNKAVGTWVALVEHVAAGGQIVLVSPDGSSDLMTLNAGPDV